MRKIPFAGVELTSQRVRGLRGTSELPGRPAADSTVLVLTYVFVCCYIEYIPSTISSTHSIIYERVACSTVCTYVFVCVVTAVELCIDY